MDTAATAALNFWDVHGVWFLIFITFFPRLTMLFAVHLVFGPLAWIGWIFAPHLTVAILATTYYWETNPILCIIAWFVALAGTGGETTVVHHFWKRR
jgi:hypothetical protein